VIISRRVDFSIFGLTHLETLPNHWLDFLNDFHTRILYSKIDRVLCELSVDAGHNSGYAWGARDAGSC